MTEPLISFADPTIRSLSIEHSPGWSLAVHEDSETAVSTELSYSWMNAITLAGPERAQSTLSPT